MAKRKYQIKEDYFDIINTSTKAYILGFLYADGYVDEIHNNVCMTLHEEDKYLLEKILKEVSPDRELMSIRNGKHFRLVFSSKKIVTSLVKQGCHQAKTFTLQFPTEEQVPNHLIRHFIRGYFDGDGSVYVNTKRKKISCSIDIVGTYNFLSHLKEFLKNTLNVNFVLKQANKKSSKHKVYRIRSTGRLQILKFLEYIYFDKDGFFLGRKYEKYLFLRNYTKKLYGQKHKLKCVINSCDKTFHGFGLCSNHYYYYYKKNKATGLLLNEFISKYNGQLP